MSYSMTATGTSIEEVTEGFEREVAKIIGWGFVRTPEFDAHLEAALDYVAHVIELAALGTGTFRITLSGHTIDGHAATPPYQSDEHQMLTITRLPDVVPTDASDGTTSISATHAPYVVIAAPTE